jgi:hypothetical protein
VKIAQRLAYLGATDKDLAIAFDTSITAIERWCAKHAEFRGALKLGKNEADQRMQRSLYQRGVGYSYDAVKIFMPAGQARGPSHSCPTGAPSGVDYFKPLLPYHRTGQGRTPQGWQHFSALNSGGSSYPLELLRVDVGVKVIRACAADDVRIHCGARRSSDDVAQVAEAQVGVRARPNVVARHSPGTASTGW